MMLGETCVSRFFLTVAVVVLVQEGLSVRAFGFQVLSRSSSNVPLSETAEYSCKLRNLWNAIDHPRLYPSSNAHWNPPVLATHNENYQMWTLGGMASAGVERVAETGFVSRLRTEILESAPNTAAFVIGDNQFNRQVQEQTFESLMVDSEHPLLSSVSMISPSPDWFSGFSDVSLADPVTGTWLANITINSFALDAGTETGDTYSLSNDAEDPALPISVFTADTVPDTGVFLTEDESRVLPVAQWECALLTTIEEEPNPVYYVVDLADSTVPTLISGEYECTFRNLWSAVDHPRMYPSSNAHWSPPVIVAHNETYEMWKPGEQSSEGVEQVAETGSVSSIRSEIEDAAPATAAYVIGDIQFNSDVQEQRLGRFLVNESTPLLSSITMIAPSPDWFSGFHDFDLRNTTSNTWWANFTLNTFPIDAGTETGDTYSLNNDPENPHAPIEQFTAMNPRTTGVFLSETHETVKAVAQWQCTLQTTVSTCKTLHELCDVNGDCCSGNCSPPGFRVSNRICRVSPSDAIRPRISGGRGGAAALGIQATRSDIP